MNKEASKAATKTIGKIMLMLLAALCIISFLYVLGTVVTINWAIVFLIVVLFGGVFALIWWAEYITYGRRG